jgi:hypothetical protein
MEQTRHRSLKQVRKYIRRGSLFQDNAAARWGSTRWLSIWPHPNRRRTRIPLTTVHGWGNRGYLALQRLSLSYFSDELDRPFRLPSLRPRPTTLHVLE